MFRKDLVIGIDTNVGQNELTSCSVFLVGYIIALVQAFTTLCMWHAKICLLHATLAGVQYFKMPALTMSAEEKQIKKENIEGNARYKEEMELKDSKMREAELKREEDVKIYAHN